MSQHTLASATFPDPTPRDPGRVNNVRVLRDVLLEEDIEGLEPTVEPQSSQAQAKLKT